jgi:hypothetical protein
MHKLAGTFYCQLKASNGFIMEKFEILRDINTQEISLETYINADPYAKGLMQVFMTKEKFESEFNLNVSNLLLMP